ncbi:MAG: hypothetical protein JOZ81_02280 [Chloroflexi bacterium]|nr:hypothetical protein [Chloroflexota bacterium]
MSRSRLRAGFGLVLGLGSLAAIGLAAPTLAAPDRRTVQVVVPADDRFTPFAVTIHAGQSVGAVDQSRYG